MRCHFGHNLGGQLKLARAVGIHRATAFARTFALQLQLTCAIRIHWATAFHLTICTTLSHQCEALLTVAGRVHRAATTLCLSSNRNHLFHFSYHDVLALLAHDFVVCCLFCLQPYSLNIRPIYYRPNV